MALRSVFVDGKISNPATGNVVHMHLIGEDTLPYLESVEINLDRGANMEMNISLAPPYEKAIELISKDNEWLRLGNTLGLRWGYADVPGAISDWYYGFMQTPEVSFGDEISVTVSAATLAWNADRVERTREWCPVVPRTFKDIAAEIATRYGLKVEYGVLGTKSLKMVNKFRQSFAQGGQTDLQFLMEKSEKFGLRMISLNDILYFVDVSEPLPGFPDVNAVFQMYGKTDISRNLYPMTEFSPETMGAMFIKQFQGTNALAYGPNDDPTVEKESKVSTDEAADNKAFTGSETVNAPPAQDGNPPKDMEDVKTKATIKVDANAGEGGRIFCLPLDGSEEEEFIDGMLSGVRESSSEDHGISVSFGSIAVPNLLPGMFVKLQGVGDYFSGTYMMQKMGLSINSGGAEMSCEAFGRGFPGVNEEIDPFAAPISYADPVDGSLDDLLFTEAKDPVE